MRRKNNLNETDIERIRKLHNSKCNFNIPERLGCTEATIKRYTDAFDAGFETPSEYDNSKAVAAGYESHSDRYAVSRFLNDKGVSKQEEFERGMETRGLIRNSRAHLVGSLNSYFDIKMDVDEALEILERKHYVGNGKVILGHPNPSGKRYAKIIRAICLDERSLGDVASEEGVTRTGVAQIKTKGLKRLYHILTKPRY